MAMGFNSAFKGLISGNCPSAVQLFVPDTSDNISSDNKL